MLKIFISQHRMTSNYQILCSFFIASGILGLICVYILVVMNQEQQHANRLLAAALFTLSYTVILNGLGYVPHFFEQYPHLWRTALPLHYLFAPLFYLYIRAVLHQELAFRRWDWLHLLPALLHLVELLPFYLQSAHHKAEYIQWIYQQESGTSQQREGLFAPWIHPILKTAAGSLYVLAEVRLLLWFRQFNASWKQENRELWRWLTGLTALLGVMYGFMLLVFLLHGSVPNLTIMVSVPVTLILFLATATLTCQPKVLYGIRGNAQPMEPEPPIHPGQAETAPPVPRITLSAEKVAQFKEQLERYMQAGEPYLHNKFPIRDLALGCGVPPHYLSAVINREYGMSYNDFINQHRVQYIIRNRYSEKWRDYTLEAIALEAGFNSRSTFNNAFKKVTGSTPSVFFAQNQMNQTGEPAKLC